jgi:hypothetical protein
MGTALPLSICNRKLRKLDNPIIKFVRQHQPESHKEHGVKKNDILISMFLVPLW